MDKPTEKTPEQIQHEANKFCREKLAWAHYKLGVTPILLEEAQIAQETRGVLAAYCTDLQKKIEAVEPPEAEVKPEPKAPYVIDATPAAQSEAVQ